MGQQIKAVEDKPKDTFNSLFGKDVEIVNMVNNLEEALSHIYINLKEPNGRLRDILCILTDMAKYMEWLTDCAMSGNYDMTKLLEKLNYYEKT